MFKDYAEFMENLEKALQDEAVAAKTYDRLAERAPGALDRKFFAELRDDERKHFELFSEIYRCLTGQEPSVCQPELPRMHSYQEELTKFLIDELDAVDMYREMFLSTYDGRIRDTIFIPLTDEMEHATRLTFLFAKTR